ncbi:GTP cyclohydrolase I [Streptomyces caeruleatus]|uniref:GTP cyclohydrolase I n=1 Tax=Streptomyces caeruleatus TaxID=661399 RepID=UPI00099E92F5|nr:GTP cyclohydrolase I FolE [Streptomyces caeruleatus]
MSVAAESRTAPRQAADNSESTLTTSHVASSPRQPVIDQEQVAGLYRQLLFALGEDPDRDGLKDTPRRVARWWSEFLEYEPGRTDTLFTHEQANVDGEEVVIVSGIVVASLCEHHLLPMTLTLTVAYCPVGQVLGLSKIARIAQAHGHRLQLQERIVGGIAEEMAKVTGASDIAVSAAGEHACMSMRGVRAMGALTTNAVTRGRFSSNEPLGQLFRGLALKGADQ